MVTGKTPTRAPRADAQRNVTAILAAAQERLAADPHATMTTPVCHSANSDGSVA